MKKSDPIARRDFLRSTALISSGTIGMSFIPNFGHAAELPADERDNVIGPREGFAPHIGTLLSMMTWMRRVILSPVKNLTVEQLDYVHDKNSNSIGSMLFHLAATERYYQIHTFEGKKWGDWNEQDKSKFDVAMSLGAEARKTIKGNSLDFYLSMLKEVRENTISEFKKRDDAWLFSVDENWPWGPTNNYCKWFHVCEHESNHNGQMKYIKSRLPKGKGKS
jgi:uncharacterized damage-inducible protein DinB